MIIYTYLLLGLISMILHMYSYKSTNVERQILLMLIPCWFAFIYLSLMKRFGHYWLGLTVYMLTAFLPVLLQSLKDIKNLKRDHLTIILFLSLILLIVSLYLITTTSL